MNHDDMSRILKYCFCAFEFELPDYDDEVELVNDYVSYIKRHLGKRKINIRVNLKSEQHKIDKP